MESHDVVVRFRPNPENDGFKITTVASPLSVDIDDISFSLPTDEEAKPLELKEGAGS